jgi:hypothetical protein
LRALLAAIKRSPIVARMTGRMWSGYEWSNVRKSPDVAASLAISCKAPVLSPSMPDCGEGA